MAARLRLLQADLAAEAGPSRVQLLQEELESALSQINPDDRLGFLRELEEQFPVMETTLQSPEVAQAPVIKEQAAVGRDAESLAQALIALASKLPEARRRTLIRQLAEGGLSEGGTRSASDWSPAAMKLLEETLKASQQSGLNVDEARLLETAALLTQLVVSLDQPLWRIWKELAPKSALRRQGDLQKTLAGYITGNQEVSRAQVQQELEALRKLIAAVVQSVGQVGKSLGRSFRPLTPMEIEAAARNEKRMMESIEAVCWRKYLELSRQHLDEAAIDANVRQIIATHAETVLGHRRQ